MDVEVSFAADGVEGEEGFAEVEAVDFGGIVFEAVEVFGLRPEADAVAGAEASGATGALVGARAGDFLDGEGVDAAALVVGGDAGEAGVDDGVDAFDGEGGFGDVGADDDAAGIAGLEGLVLLVWGEFAVEWEDAGVFGEGAAVEGGDGFADFVSAGHEDEEVAVEVLFGDEGFCGAGGLVPEGFEVSGFVAERGLVGDVDWEGASGGVEDFAGVEVIL